MSSLVAACRYLAHPSQHLSACGGRSGVCGEMPLQRGSKGVCNCVEDIAQGSRVEVMTAGVDGAGGASGQNSEVQKRQFPTARRFPTTLLNQSQPFSTAKA